MKIAAKTFFFIFSLAFLLYLILPAPLFPDAPKGFVESIEPADHETPLRRGYYTDVTRQKVTAYYQSKFKGYLLNYPPEEAKTLVRDQTQSTFLEEIVHPFRESLFVNGNEPKEEQKKLFLNGRPVRQKITVKYVPSPYPVRISLALATLVLIFVLGKELANA